MPKPSKTPASTSVKAKAVRPKSTSKVAKASSVSKAKEQKPAAPAKKTVVAKEPVKAGSPSKVKAAQPALAPSKPKSAAPTPLSKPAAPAVSHISTPSNPPTTSKPETSAPVLAQEKAAAPSAPSSAEPSAKDDKVITMRPPIVVKDLAVKLNLKPFQIIHQLMEMNVFATLNQTVDEEVARTIVTKNGFVFDVEKRERGAGQVHAPAKVVVPTPAVHAPTAKLEPRAPVITFMGHVDHGKTSLLDAIRQARVAAGEAGGITQHIGAYQIERNGHLITFLDTPGHAAFTAMRARGANITDIVVLVVAADDGLMPQTLEAISHARAAKVSLMVAINKVDLASANITRVKSQLQEQGLVAEDYGGDTICCEVSATKGTGIERLLEMMMLQAEILELKADVSGAAAGRIIESQFEQGRGPTATAIVTRGILRVGDSIIAGPHSGRVKALLNDLGKNVKEARPSTPVKILGFDGIPSPGEEFNVMKSEREARELAEERTQTQRTAKLESGPKVTLENLLSSINNSQRKNLKLILKGDVQGSMEAIAASLNKIESKKIDLEIIHNAVGPISESDILLAQASQAIVIGFNTKTDGAAAAAAKREGVQIKLFSIIYELIDQVRDAMTGMLDPELRETQLGTARVKQVFDLSKFPVAGCEVVTGRITKSGRARVLRRKQPIYDGSIVTLKRFQDDTNEVRAGLECGIRLGNFTEYEADDIIECYQLEKIAQSL